MTQSIRREDVPAIVDLSAYSPGDLWRLWRRVGWALTVKGWALANLWKERNRSRQQLRELDAHALCDIGITPEQAGKESRKVFWQE